MSEWYTVFQKNYELGKEKVLELEQRASKLREELEESRELFYEVLELLPYLSQKKPYKFMTIDSESAERNIGNDLYRLKEDFSHMLEYDLMQESPDKVVEYLLAHPKYITTNAKGETEPITFSLVEGVKNHEILRRLIENVPRITSEVEQLLTFLTEFHYMGRYENGTPAQYWAKGYISPKGSAQLEYIKILIAAAPRGEKILTVGKGTGSSIPYLITEQEWYGFDDDDEPVVAREKYRAKQIRRGKRIKSPVADKLAFVVPILLHNGFTWADIFTQDVISNIVNGFNEYIDTPYLAQWIAEYPQLYEIFLAIAPPETIALLREYLLVMEHQDVRNATLSLGDRESLAHKMMTVIDEETQKQRRHV